MTRTITVVVTVFNEVGSLPAWLAGLERQSLYPDQIIVVDGGSQDGTWELLVGFSESSPLKLDIYQAPGSGISEGRNLAFERATGQIIVITDAGTCPDGDWVNQITTPFDDETVDVVSGFFEGDRSSLWNRTLVAATLPDADEIDPDSFQPSSRSVAIRRRWIDAGFRYPEWLDYCEDLIFDLLLKDGGATFRWQPSAVVKFEPRHNPKAFAIQYFRYARGDGKSGLFLKRHLVRYASYLTLALVLKRRRPLEMLATSALALIHVRRPTRRLLKSPDVSMGDLILGVPLIAVQVLIGDVAKMTGYPVGLAWRAKRLGLRSITFGWRKVHRKMTVLDR